MKNNLAIQPDELKILHKILKKHLSKKSAVWVFGSRAKGAARKYSDIDLAIDANGQPLTIDTITALAFDFEESDLPYKVDIVDWNNISDHFKKIILQDHVVIW